MPNLPPGSTQLIFVGIIVFTFLAFSLFVWGIVPDEVEEEDIYGYRLTKRKRLIEENGLYALVLPMVQLFAHHFSHLPDQFLGIDVVAAPWDQIGPQLIDR